MRTFLKVILVIVTLILASFAVTLIKYSQGSYGPVGIVIAVAVGAAIKAIWSYGNEKPDESSSKEVDKLNKK